MKSTNRKYLYIVSITLEYEGQRFVVEDRRNTDDDYDESLLLIEFDWYENNMSCDCNRSQFIRDQCDSSFPDMQCGERIKLIDLVIRQENGEHL